MFLLARLWFCIVRLRWQGWAHQRFCLDARVGAKFLPSQEYEYDQDD